MIARICDEVNRSFDRPKREVTGGSLSNRKIEIALAIYSLMNLTFLGCLVRGFPLLLVFFAGGATRRWPDAFLPGRSKSYAYTHIRIHARMHRRAESRPAAGYGGKDWEEGEGRELTAHTASIPPLGYVSPINAWQRHPVAP
jgi:hypothetical protein